MDSFCRLSIPWFSSLFQLDEGLPPFYPPILRDTPFEPVSGTYFFANASFNTGHTHPLFSGLHDPDDIALPPQMIRWPQDSPAVLPVALATQSQRNPVPPWLPADSKTLYQQGLEALTTEDALHNANPAHWLPAYCAHALHNFAEEHLSVLANPDTLASFPTEVVDPLLRSETSKAQEYLQGLLSTADTGYKTVLRRRPVPLTDGPPDDDYIVSLNIASLKSTRLYISTWSTAKLRSWPRFSQALTFLNPPLAGCACKPSKATTAGMCQATLIPTTQNVIATNKFCVLSHGNLRPMSKDVLETLLILDFQARGKGRRFQYGGRTIKEYAVRLAPATQAAAGPEGPGLPTVWPEVSMMGADHLRKVAGYDFHDLRRKYDVRTMWGDLDPQWRLLQSQSVAFGSSCQLGSNTHSEFFQVDWSLLTLSTC